MLDLIKIAKTEAEGGDLKSLLNTFYSETEIRPQGYPDAMVWKYEKHLY